MAITDYFTKERSDQNLPYHNLSAILSCSRQFEASYIENVLRNWRAEYSMIQECFESFSGRLSVVVVVFLDSETISYPESTPYRPKKPKAGRWGREDQRAGNLGSFRVIVIDGFHRDVIKL